MLADNRLEEIGARLEIADGLIAQDKPYPEFTAHAPQDIRDLLNEVAQLRGFVRRVTHTVAKEHSELLQLRTPNDYEVLF